MTVRTDLFSAYPGIPLILFGLPFIVGLLAGFQGVWQRFQNNAFRAVRTPPGTGYLVSRGLVPLGTFAALYAFRGLAVADATTWGLAAASGLGSEAVLRTKVYLKTDQKGVDLYRGLFDLLKFYQDICLEAAAGRLAESIKAFVQKSMNEGPSFPEVLKKVRQNLGFLDPSLLARDLNLVEKDLKRLEAEYTTRLATLQQGNPGPSQAQLNDLEREYRIKLGYLLLTAVKQSRRNYRTVAE